MSDFEIISNILEKKFPNELERPFEILCNSNQYTIEFPQSDEWYNTYFCFDIDGNLIDINGVRPA